MKTFLKYLIFTILFTLGTIYSQTLYFCESVDKEKKPVSQTNSFAISPKGGYLYFFVDLGYEIESDEVYYEIYRVDSKGKEIYDRTIYKDIDPKTNKFYHQITFSSPGLYNIYVYRGDGIYITSGSLKITSK